MDVTPLRRALLVLTLTATATFAIPLSISAENSDMQIRVLEGGWELSVTGKDPWIFTSDFPADADLASMAFSLEYMVKEDTSTILYSIAKEGLGIRPGYLKKTNGWAPLIVPLRFFATPENQILTARRYRLGFGSTTNQVIRLRNLSLRALTDQDCEIEKTLVKNRDAQKPHEVFIQNERIRIGIDLNMGGTITYVSEAKTDRNLVNCHDPGRVIQQSYYSGPKPYGDPHPKWKNWGWNPIGAGDVYGNRARVADYRSTGDSLWVKTVPMQWALDQVPGDCFFVSTIRLSSNTAQVTCELNNFRADPTQYGAMSQELPALYTIGKLYRMFAYTNLAPFTGGEVALIPTEKKPGEFIWKRVVPTECWAAFADDDGKALGLILPGCMKWLGGFVGTRNVGGAFDNNTGYLAPLFREVLDHNIIYQYRYQLVVGTVSEVRAHATAIRAPNGIRAVFQKDRQHWYYEKASDKGWPIPGRLIVHATNTAGAVVSPILLFSKQSTPVLRVKALHRLASPEARTMELCFAPGFEGNREETPLLVPIQGDGAAHVYTFDLKNTAWTEGPGALKLRLASGKSAGPGDTVEISWISEDEPRD